MFQTESTRADDQTSPETAEHLSAAQRPPEADQEVRPKSPRHRAAGVSSGQDQGGDDTSQRGEEKDGGTDPHL